MSHFSSAVPNIAYGKIFIEEDYLLIDILRFKDMAITGYVRNIFTHEIEISPITVSAIPVQPMQVEDNLAQAENMWRIIKVTNFLTCVSVAHEVMQ